MTLYHAVKAMRMIKQFEDGRIKLLYVPANYEDAAPFVEQVVYALAYIVESTAEQVCHKPAGLGNKEADEGIVKEVFGDLYKKGLVNGVGEKETMR